MRHPISSAFSILALALTLLLSPAPLSAAPFEIDFQNWSDDRLFERAADAYHAADYVWALKAYRELLSRPIEGDMRVPALYNEGLCFEKGQFWEEAAMAYEEITQRFSSSSSAQDAWFRLGVIRETQAHHAQAEQAYREILRRYPQLEPADARAVEVQLAWQQLQQGKEQEALKILNRVRKVWAALPAEDVYVERYYVGKVHVALGIMLSRYAGEIDFQRPLFGHGLTRYLLAHALGREDPWRSAQLAERVTRQRAARAQYQQALRQKTPIWDSAGYYQMGEDLEAFYRALNEAPPPSRLTAAQLELYRQMLRGRTRDYLVDAAYLYLRGNALAVGWNDESDWARKLKRKVKVIEAKGVDGLGQSAG